MVAAAVAIRGPTPGISINFTLPRHTDKLFFNTIYQQVQFAQSVVLVLQQRDEIRR